MKTISALVVAALALAAVSPANANAVKDVVAVTSAPMSSAGLLKVNMLLKSARSGPVNIEMGRSSAQECSTGPLLRVVQVGTRAVVYPKKGEGSMCSQEMQSKTLAGRSSVVFKRELKLPAGQYMVESWIDGFVNGTKTRIAAAPVRVTVR